MKHLTTTFIEHKKLEIMTKFKTMTVTELDRLYWETYGNIKDQRTYREYCETGAAIMKELESRGIITLDDICNAIKKERV